MLTVQCVTFIGGLNALIAIHLGLHFRPPPHAFCFLSVTFYNMETSIVPLRRDQVLIGIDNLNWVLYFIEMKCKCSFRFRYMH